MIYVIATLTCKTNKHTPFLAGARHVIAATRKEDGCVFYDLTQSITEPDVFTFVERWTTREALEAHFKTPHLDAWRKISGACTSARVVEIVHAGQIEKL